jgi:hypothetical protein
MTTSAIGTPSGSGDVSPEELGSARKSTDTRGDVSNSGRSFDTAWSQFRERFGRAGFVSFEELVQAFFKLYKTLDFTGMTEARRMQFEAFNLKVKAAEENYKSAMMSGITTIAILAPGVAIGTGLAGAGLYKHLKGDGVGATKGASNGKEKHGIVDSQQGRMPDSKMLAADNGGQNSTKQPIDADKPLAVKDAAADTDWRGPFQGVAMFMLPSGSSAAGELAGAEPQKQSDILKALADIVEDYVRQLTERSSSWDQGVRQLAQTLASN